MVRSLNLFRRLALLLLCAKLSVGEGAPSRPRTARSLDKEEDYFKLKDSYQRLDIAANPKEAQRLLEAEKEEMNLQVVREMFDLESGFPPGNLTQIYQASDYMLRLYNSVADNRTGNLLARRTAVKTKGPSDPTELIRSFSCKEAKEYRGNWRLSFNAAQLPQTTKNSKTAVFYAELALFRLGCVRKTNLDRRAERKGWKTEVELFAQLHPDKESAKHFRVDSDTLSFNLANCWQTFNVTAAVRNWQLSRHLGLRHFVLLQRKKKRDRRTLDYHFQLAPGVNAYGRRPVLVIYFGKTVHTEAQMDADTDDVVAVEYRQKRDAQTPALVANPHQKERNNLRHRFTSTTNTPHYKDCAKRDFFIDFSRVGWDRWVVAPTGYKAFRCAGSCAFPIGKNVRATNHANLEAFLAFLDQAMGKPELDLPGSGVCCVPTQHRKISMIYLDESGNTRIKIFKKMVADRCGCR